MCVHIRKSVCINKGWSISPWKIAQGILLLARPSDWLVIFRRMPRAVQPVSTIFVRKIREKKKQQLICSIGHCSVINIGPRFWQASFEEMQWSQFFANRNIHSAISSDLLTCPRTKTTGNKSVYLYVYFRRVVPVSVSVTQFVSSS